MTLTCVYVTTICQRASPLATRAGSENGLNVAHCIVCV